jgi:hypothetical protein
MSRTKIPVSSLQLASAAYARAARLGTPDQIVKARTALNEAKIRAWVQRTLASAPPNLSKKTVATLNRLLTVDEK